MRSALVVMLALLPVSLPGGRLDAQDAQRRDAFAAPSIDARADSAAVIVRVTSRKLPHELGDVALLNCSFSSSHDALLENIIPWLCTRRQSGTLVRIEADSMSFMRNGRLVRLVAGDVRRLEVRHGRSTARTVAWTAYGALTGLIGSGLIGVGGGYRNDAQFIGTAIVLTVGGGAIGGYRGGQRWSEWPRPLTASSASSR